MLFCGLNIGFRLSEVNGSNRRFRSIARPRRAGGAHERSEWEGPAVIGSSRRDLPSSL
jgi:hypothetical protein